jgi:RHS repeat-associated protein
LTFTYDNDGRLSTEVTSGPGTGQPTVTLTYSYDQLGEETSVTDSLSSQGITTYSYDNAQRLNKITTSYGGTAGPQISFNYDNGGRLTSTARQIGSGSFATHVDTTVTYDAANRVATTTHGVSVYGFGGWSTTPLATQVYSYDNANRVTSEKDAEGTASFTYDNANELTGVTGSRSESYSYDLNGNRTGTGYSTTIMNEIATSPGPTTYTYDNAGNMITSKTGSTTTTYTYDFRNRLTNVTTGGTVVGTFTYNALDQRIGAKDNGTQTWTVYDGQSADASPYADFNGSGSLTVRYLFGPGVVNGAVMSVILARTSSGGTTAWYLADKLGSVRDIVDTSGNVLDHIVYDSFGNIVTETNATNGDRFKFAGMQYAATIGQYYDHARWYGSVAGRFLNQDPMGFAAHDANLYRYVGNGATNVTDPSGLDFASDYWYYLTNPSQMDTDLQKAQKAALTVAIATATLATAGATGGLTSTAYANFYMFSTAWGGVVYGTTAWLNGGDVATGVLNGMQIGFSAAGYVSVGYAIIERTLLQCVSGLCFVAGTPVLTGEPAAGRMADEENGAAERSVVFRNEILAATLLAAGAIPSFVQRTRRRKPGELPSPYDLDDQRDGEDDDESPKRVSFSHGSGRRVGEVVDPERSGARSLACDLLADDGRRIHGIRSDRRSSTGKKAWRQAWLAACLLLAALLAGRAANHRGQVLSTTRAETARGRASQFIETIQVGQRVLTSANQTSGSVIPPTSVQANKWRRLRLRADNRWADGTPDVIEVETLQPPEWIEANRAQPGALVPFPLDLQDMGLPGGLLARVVSNEPCPRLEQGFGRLVLSTVSHLNNDVWQIEVIDQNGRREVIRPTGFHKVYSASQNAWVSAKDLGPGERLHGVSGTVVVRTVARVPGVHRVYNMTVEGEHIYRVSNLGVLVHNVGCEGPSRGPSWPTARRDYWKYRAENAAEGEFSPQNLQRMQKGKPPLHPETGDPMELHHTPIPQRDGGPNTPDNLQEVWPWEHAEIDPYRYYRGPAPPGPGLPGK